MNKKLLAVCLSIVAVTIAVVIWFSFADTSSIVVPVNEATFEAIQKFDSDVVFLTSRDNPIRTLQGLTSNEIAEWSGTQSPGAPVGLDGAFIDKVRAFQEAIGISNAGSVSTIGIGKGHVKISGLKSYNSQKPVRLFITRQFFEPTLDDAIRVTFKKED